MILKHKIKMETTGCFASWLYGKVERHHQTITNMCNAALFDSKNHINKWCFSMETSEEIYNNLGHSDLNETPNFLCSGSRVSIKDIRVWVCIIYVKKSKSQNNRP